MISHKLVVKNIPSNYIISTELLEKNVLFLHWRWDSSTTFDWLYQEFEKDGLSCIGVDFPWFGSTWMPWDDRKIDDYVDRTVELLEKIDINDDILMIWHSFWCRVLIKAIATWKLHPERIILIWAGGIQENNSRRYFPILKFWKKVLNSVWLWSMSKKIQSRIRSDDYNNAWELSQVFLNTIWEDLSHLLSSIQTPTLLLWWSDDDQTPLKHWNIMNNMIQNSTLEVIQWWTHFVHQESTWAIYDLIKKFAKIK